MWQAQWCPCPRILWTCDLTWQRDFTDVAMVTDFEMENYPGFIQRVQYNHRSTLKWRTFLSWVERKGMMDGGSERHAALLRWEAKEGVMTQGVWETSRHWKRQGKRFSHCTHIRDIFWRPLIQSAPWEREELREEGPGSSVTHILLGQERETWGKGSPGLAE